MRVVAIIAAGGRGARLGRAVPKQLVEIGGRSILQRSIDAFEAGGRVGEIIVAAPREWVADAPKYARGGRTPLRLVAGGDRRQDSVANAFDTVSRETDVVVVHDAARPFVSDRLIARTIDAASTTGAAIAALAASDTVKQAAGPADQRVVTGTLDRDAIFLAQTPQAFTYRVLEDAIALGRAGRVATDEAELAEAAGHSVRLVEGDPTNIKVTTPQDLAYARRLVEGDSSPTLLRVGVGYDLHTLVKGRPLMLGGVMIPYEMGLAGHSDADAVYHAITDAVLGAIGAGDIGLHFPDTDDRWKDSASALFLRHAGTLVREAGYEVQNVDAVIVAEQPKLSPHVEDMRRHIAETLGISPNAVGIKGKTNEGVDATGQGRAIAVHAVALVRGIRDPSGDR